jgi:hypothetical protein
MEQLKTDFNGEQKMEVTRIVLEQAHHHRLGGLYLLYAGSSLKSFYAYMTLELFHKAFRNK